MTHGEVTSVELQIRKAVLRRLLRGEPVDLVELSASARLRPDEVAPVLSNLSERGAIHLMNGVLIAAYPLSGMPTRHRARRDGTIIYANCALDALAVPFMVDEIVGIESELRALWKSDQAADERRSRLGGPSGISRRVSRGAGLL